MVPHPGLRERALGALTGLTYAEAPAAQPEAWAALQAPGGDVRIPGGGESLLDLRARMQHTLLELAAAHPGGRLLVVSHGGALHAVHQVARGYAAPGRVGNCSVAVLMAEGRLAVAGQPRPLQNGCCSGDGAAGTDSVVGSSPAAACAAADGGSGRASRPLLAMLSWNDLHELAKDGLFNPTGGGGDARAL